MLGWLQSNDRFEDRLRIGPEEGTLTCVSRTECDGPPMIGVFSDSLGERVLFYRWHERLRLRIGSSEAMSLDGCEANWQMVSPEEAQFVLKRDGRVLVDKSYRVDESVLGLETDPTSFAEAEDFDIYQFIANVVTDPERSARIFR